MGQSSSNRRRANNNNYRQSNPYPYPPPPPPPPNSVYPHNYYTAPYPAPPPPSYANSNSYSNPLDSAVNSLMTVFDNLMGRGAYNPRQYPPQNYYGAHQGAGTSSSSPYPYYYYPSSSSAAAAAAAGGSRQQQQQQQEMPQFVEQQKAKTIKNDVNVHKDTIRLEPDEQKPDQYLVSFVFDALLDGSVTIYYFAKEEESCTFSPVYEKLYTPTKIPFQKGAGQNFCQPSGNGMDLGFFELDDLAKPMHGDVFPLVIYAESCPLPPTPDELVDQSTVSANAQITQAIIEKNSVGSFQVKVIKQILWAHGERYELQEIFGIASTDEPESSGDNVDDMGKECVICLSEPRNTAVLPCRHMCMCSECAKALSLQSNKCPICRQPVEKLMEIKVSSSEQ